MSEGPSNGAVAAERTADGDVALARVDATAKPSDALLALIRELAQGIVASPTRVLSSFPEATLRRAQRLIATLAGAPPSQVADPKTVDPADFALAVLSVEVAAYFRALAPPGPATATLIHGICTAAAAQRLARRMNGAAGRRETAFTAGLLHDLGRVMLAAVFSRSYARMLAERRPSQRNVVDAERAMFGVDHPAVGRHVAARWKLPTNLSETIWLYHAASEVIPRSVEAPELLVLVQTAHAIATAVLEVQPAGYDALGGGLSGFARSDWSGADLHEIRTAVAEEIEIYAAVLELQDALEPAGGMDAESMDFDPPSTETEDVRPAACAVTRFVSRLSEECSPVEVIRSLTAAIVDCCVADAAAAFYLRRSGRTADVVTADGEAGIVELSDELLAAIRDLRRSPATAPGRALRHSLFARGYFESELEWKVAPLVHGEELLGAVFVGTREGRAAVELPPAPRAVAALALAQARARANLQLLSNDLADANRRLQQAQSRVLRSRTLSMIAEMAAGAGHELNSPLFVISGRAELLLGRTPDPSARAALSLIHEKALECSRIVTELMEFARPPAPAKGRVEIGALLREASAAATEQGLIRADRLDVAERIDGGAGVADASEVLEGDATQLRRAIDELLRNAADAVEENRGRISIELRPAAPPDARIGGPHPDTAGKDGDSRGAASAPTDRWIEIAVRDTGVGMSSAVCERAFDPFYSHRPAGRRRGLGLTRAYRIVEAHGGRLWLESRPGQGTTAHILLPATRPQEPHASASDAVAG